MKTPKFRVLTLGLVAVLAVLGLGHTVRKAPADVPVSTAAPKPEPSLSESLDTQPLALAEVEEASNESQGAAPSATSTNTGTNSIKVVQAAVVPEKISPALQEIVKLVQAGINEGVILSYVTNSTNVFNMTSEEIVYLNDLGVSSEVMTALIQRDNTAEAREHKLTAGAAKPLPPSLVLNTPATNIYKQGQGVVQVYPDTQSSLPPGYEETEPATTYAPPAEEQQPVTVNHFYGALSPYGSWVDVPDYGLCWRPTVAVVDPYWAPYRNNGRWLNTDYGWYWYSDYSWGWAPFHYGRWASYPGYGWLWAPGTRWGPAWVTWRYSSSYCGWAPLPPHCDYVDGFGLYYRNAAVGIGFGFGTALGSHCYTFIPTDKFCHRKPGLHYAKHGDNKHHVENSVAINNYVSGKNNTVINRGIGVDRIARANQGGVPSAQVRSAQFGSVSTPQAARAERIETAGKNAVVVAPRIPSGGRQVGNGSSMIQNGNKATSAKAVGSFTAAPNGNNIPAPRPPPVRNTGASGTSRSLPNKAVNRPISTDNQVVVAGATPQAAAPAPPTQNRPGAVRANTAQNQSSAPAGSRLVSGSQQRNNGGNEVRPNAGAAVPRVQSQSGVIHGFSPSARPAQAQSGAVQSRPNQAQPQVNRMEVVHSSGQNVAQRPSAVYSGGNGGGAPRAAQMQNYHAAPRAAQQNHQAAPRASAPSHHASPQSSSSHRSAPSPAASAPAPRSAPVHQSSGGGGNRGGGGGGGGGNRGGGNRGNG